METRFLESLISVAQDGSIAAAARRQGLTPAAVGQRIQALEQELGAPLLERVGHRSRPTKACLRLLPHARELVSLAMRLSEKVDLDGMTGTIRIGVISTLFQDLIPPVLRQVTAELPSLRLNLLPGTSKDLYRAFLNDEIEGALLVEPPFELPKTATLGLLFCEPMVLLAPKGFDGTLDTALRDYRFLRYDSTSWGGMLVDHFLRDKKVRVDPLVELDSLETIAILVQEGLGFSLVPHWKGLNRYAGEIYVSKPLSPDHVRRLGMLSSPQDRNNPLWSAFRSIVSECACAIEQPLMRDR